MSVLVTFRHVLTSLQFIVSISHLGLCAGLGLGRELNLSGFEDGVLLKNILLRLVVAKRLQEHTHTNQC